MSDKQEVQSNLPEQEADVQSNDVQPEVDNKSWTAEQLSRRLKEVNEEARANRKKYVEEKRRREELEKKAMAENGQYKELAEVWQRKATDAEKMAEQIKQAFAVKSISDTVAMEAQRLGCVDPEALINLVNINELPLDESFNVDREHVKAMLEDMRKKKPYFFQKSAPRVLDATPAKPEKPSLDLNKLSILEKAALLSELKKQGK